MGTGPWGNRYLLCVDRPLTERHIERLSGAIAVNSHRDGVSSLVLEQEIDQGILRTNFLVVQRGDAPRQA